MTHFPDSAQNKPLFTISLPSLTDIYTLRPVFEMWVRDRATNQIWDAKIKLIQDQIAESIQGISDYHYFVAHNEQKQAIGVVGCRTPDEMMSMAATTDFPLEVVDLFVSPNMAGKGVATKLLKQIIAYAKVKGFTEILLNCRPSYRESAWGFYMKKMGEPIGIIHNAYHFDEEVTKYFSPGEGFADAILEAGDAPVWRMFL